MPSVLYRRARSLGRVGDACWCAQSRGDASFFVMWRQNAGVWRCAELWHVAAVQQCCTYAALAHVAWVASSFFEGTGFPLEWKIARLMLDCVATWPVL